MTNDCVSITKTLMVKGVKLKTERYEKYIKKANVSAKINNCHTKKFIYFPAEQ